MSQELMRSEIALAKCHYSFVDKKPYFVIGTYSLSMPSMDSRHIANSSL